LACVVLAFLATCWLATPNLADDPPPDGGDDLSDDDVGDEIEKKPEADPSGMDDAGLVRIRSGVGDILLATLRGGHAGDRFGTSVAVINDLNADGELDLIVGAPRAQQRGRAYIFYGPFKTDDEGSVNVLSLSALNAPWIIEANYLDDEDFGSLVAPLADINGDSIADIRVMSWVADDLGNDSTRTYIYSGDLTTWTVEDGPWLIGTLDGPASWALWQPMIGDLDNNAAVDATDLARLTAMLGTTGTASDPLTFAHGDFNADNLVDAIDMGLLLDRLNQSAYSSAVPPGGGVGFCGITTTGEIIGRFCQGTQGTGNERPGSGTGGGGTSGGGGGGSGGGSGTGGGGGSGGGVPPNCLAIGNPEETNYVCVGDTVCLTATGNGVIPQGSLTWTVTTTGAPGSATIDANGCLTATEAGEITVEASIGPTCKGTKRLTIGNGQPLTVTFESLQGNWTIDDNPNVGGGKRVFPDHPLPPTGSDSASIIDSRRRVRLVATLTHPEPGVVVRFLVLDPDDPFTNMLTLDENAMDDEDNRDSISTNLWLSATTNDQGVATTSFPVSLKPGDNYLVAASTCPASLNGLTANDVAPPSSPPPGVYLSPMLTVWRHLWIEQDCMSIPTVPQYTYTSAGIASSVAQLPPPTGGGPNPPPPHFTVNLGFNPGDILQETWNAQNALEGGWITFTACTPPQSFQIYSNTDAGLLGNDSLECVGTLPACAATSPFTLVDDDVVPWTAPLTTAGLGVLPPAYQDAYIEAVLLPSSPVGGAGSYSDWIPFQINVDIMEDTAWFAARDVQSSRLFWAHLIVFSYQPMAVDDVDPDNSRAFSPPSTPVPGAEHPTMGETPANHSRSAIHMQIFLETNLFTTIDRVIAHEMGHSRGSDPELHPDGGLMSEGAPPNESRFTHTTLDRFRDVETW